MDSGISELGQLIIVLLKTRTTTGSSNSLIASFQLSSAVQSTQPFEFEEDEEEVSIDEEFRFTVQSDSKQLQISIQEGDENAGTGVVEISGNWSNHEFDDWIQVGSYELFLEMTFLSVISQSVFLCTSTDDLC